MGLHCITYLSNLCYISLKLKSAINNRRYIYNRHNLMQKNNCRNNRSCSVICLVLVAGEELCQLNLYKIIGKG